MSGRVARALTVAGSDSGGGAGLAADLKTFESHGVWGLVAVTAVTAQNTQGVSSFERVSPGLVAAQIAAVAGDIGVDAVKTGMLADADVVVAVADALGGLAGVPVVVDPVHVSKHGDPLLHPDAVEAMRASLVPLAALVTPNLPEAASLAGRDDDIGERGGMEEAGRGILDLGAAAVLVKGGHLAGEAPDCLVTPDGVRWFEAERLPGSDTHGTGCVLSAAIAARLALGDELVAAVERSKAFVTEAIRHGLRLGSGVGPVNPGAVLGSSSV